MSVRPRRSVLTWPLVVLVLGAAGWLGWRWLAGGTRVETPPLHQAALGALRVTVLESGSLEALDSLVIASQVEGQVAIVHLVDEGTVLTQEDVDQGRVLVRLDSSDLEEKIARQQLDVQTAQAARVNAVTGLEIQQKEDASKERQAVLKVEFARIDLRRTVGEPLAESLEELNRRVAQGAAGPTDLEQAIRAVLDDPRLRGETLQRLRELRSAQSLADEELKRAEVKWDWSKRLLAKDFVSRDEEDADRLAVERHRVEREKAETALVQFRTYDAPKAITRLLSDLVEAEGELQRTRERARLAEERGRAEVAAKKEQETLQQRRYERFQAQLAACEIRAPRPGLVLYASSTGERSYDESKRITQGGQVRERQAILTLPDTSRMGVRINVHESAIGKVKPGQDVKVSVEGGGDRPLAGVVDSVKDLPNPSDRWMNPDLKLYTTMIRLSETFAGLKPGLTAKAEIQVESLSDVLTVPVQCVAGPVGRPTVWVWSGHESVERRVTLGSTNDRFVVITTGLEPGESILLAPPRSGTGEGPRPGGDLPPAPATLGAAGAPAAARPQGAPAQPVPGGGSTAPARRRGPGTSGEPPAR